MKPNKIKIFILLLLFFSANLIFAQNKLDEALNAIKDKNYDNAFSIANDFLKIDSTYSALKILVALQANNYTNPELYRSLGDAYKKSGIDEVAILNYQKLLKQLPNDLDTKFKLAKIYEDDKNYKDAVNEYLDIIAQDSTNKDALFKVGTILYEANMYSDAAIYLQKYLNYADNEKVFRDATKANIEIKNYQKAYDLAINGLKKYPDDQELKRTAAIASYWLKNYDEVTKYMSQLDDSLLTAKDLMKLGESFETLNKDSAAINILNKAVAKDSSAINLFMDFGDINYSQKDYAAAAMYYKRLSELKPNFEPAFRFLGFSYLQLQKYNETRLALLRSVELNDTMVVSYFWLAQTYKAMDSTKEAIKTFDEMLKTVRGKENIYKDEIAEANGYLGEVYFQQKNYNLAIEHLNKAVMIKPDILIFNLMLASAYHSNGNTDNAIKYYKRVLQLDPKNEIAKKGLRLLSAD